MNFTDISYLEKGNPRQQKVFKLLNSLRIFEYFSDYSPLLAGTIPLAIDVDSSDLDIVLEVHEFNVFEARVRELYSKYSDFKVKYLENRKQNCQVITFIVDGEIIQLFASSEPSFSQAAYRHMIQEYRLLQSGGRELKDRVIELKLSGINTEQAFASILKLEGDCFEAILELEALRDHDISQLVAWELYRIKIRRITPKDDILLGEIIRNSFIDYDAKQEGTVFSDSVIDRLSESFSKERSAYFVLESESGVVGGAGIQPLKDGPVDVCELQKMYIKNEVRGKRLGKTLLDQCLEFARTQGFTKCYLESLPELKDALKMYEAAGFEYIPERMGDTGYFGCSLYMILSLL